MNLNEIPEQNFNLWREIILPKEWDEQQHINKVKIVFSHSINWLISLKEFF